MRMGAYLQSRRQRQPGSIRHSRVQEDAPAREPSAAVHATQEALPPAEAKPTGHFTQLVPLRP